MILIHILTILAFIFVSWLLWDRHYGYKRFLKKYEAKEKQRNSLNYEGNSKKKNSANKKNVVVGPATALAGVAMIHHLKKHNHKENEVVTAFDDINDLYDEELNHLYMMDEEKAIDYYDEVQNVDNAAYDDYMASIDDDY